jgi:hypothetical protein
LNCRPFGGTFSTRLQGTIADLYDKSLNVLNNKGLSFGHFVGSKRFAQVAVLQSG